MPSTDVLIVEDEAVIALDLTRRLNKLGYRVAAALASGEEALAWAAQQRPDLVLMDIVLCGQLDGIRTADELRRRYGLPVIFLTAYSDDKTLSRASGVRPYGYLLKPFDDRELYTAIEMALYRARFEQQLRESEERFRLIAENAPDYILLLELTGEIKFVNRTGARPREQVIGSNLLSWIDPEHQARFRTALQGAQTGTLTEIELPVSIQGAGERWFSGRLAPLYVDGKIVSIVAIGADITERRLAEETQRRYAAELEAQNAELDAFAHTVAHDLNNPIGLMVGFADMMSENYADLSDAAFQRALQTVISSGLKATAIVESLLLLASIRQQDVQLEPIEMSGFSVRDHGPGLTLEQQQRLFAPFERLGQARVKGHGLGLSIVRRIADKLGGQVGVDSQPGQGSTFYFTLPAANSASRLPPNL